MELTGDMEKDLKKLQEEAREEERIKKLSKHELEGVPSPKKKKLHAIKKKARKLNARMHRLNPNKKV